MNSLSKFLITIFGMLLSISAYSIDQNVVLNEISIKKSTKMQSVKRVDKKGQTTYYISIICKQEEIGKIYSYEINNIIQVLTSYQAEVQKLNASVNSKEISFDLLNRKSIRISKKGSSAKGKSYNLSEVIDGMEQCRAKMKECGCTYFDREDLFSGLSGSEVKAISQLNYIIFSLARIIHSEDLAVLLEEKNNTVNNWNLENQLTELNDYLSADDGYNNTLQELINNVKDGRRLRVKAEKEMENAMKNAISGAIGQAWFTPNIASTIITLVKTAAQTVIDYQSAVNAINDSMDDELWQLGKYRADKLSECQSKCINIAEEITKKYDLRECYRLNIEDASKFSKCLDCADPSDRLEALKRLYETLSFQHSVGYFAPYWYFIGDANIKIGRIDDGLEAYKKYLDMSNQMPVFRKDVYKGLAVLDIVQYDNNLTTTEKVDLIKKNVLYNLQDNGPALILAAVILYQSGYTDDASKVLLDAALNDNITCQNSILLALSEYYRLYEHNTELTKKIFKTVAKIKNVDIDTYLDYYMIVKNNPNSPILLKKIEEISVYFGEQAVLGKIANVLSYHPFYKSIALPFTGVRLNVVSPFCFFHKSDICGYLEYWSLNAVHIIDKTEFDNLAAVDISDFKTIKQEWWPSLGTPWDKKHYVFRPDLDFSDDERLPDMLQNIDEKDKGLLHQEWKNKANANHLLISDEKMVFKHDISTNLAIMAFNPGKNDVPYTNFIEKENNGYEFKLVTKNYVLTFSSIENNKYVSFKFKDVSYKKD